MREWIAYASLVFAACVALAYVAKSSVRAGMPWYKFLGVTVFFTVAGILLLPYDETMESPDGQQPPPDSPYNNAAFFDAEAGYKNKDYQYSCNKFANLHDEGDFRATYRLAYDMIFGGGYCARITENLDIYANMHNSLVIERNLKDKLDPNKNSVASFVAAGLRGYIAAQMIEIAANAGYAPAQATLGRLYMHFQVDSYVPKDFSLARDWLTKASAAENGYADYLLGVLAENKAMSGTPAEHYTRAASRGHLYSMKVISQSMYFGRNGFNEDKREALIWLNKLSEQNDDIDKKIWAQNFIQRYYLENVHRQK